MTALQKSFYIAFEQQSILVTMPPISSSLRVDTRAPAHRSASATILGNPSPEDETAELKKKLSHFTRNNDRKAVLRALNKSRLLANITLDPVPPVQKSTDATIQWKELEEEVVNGTTVLLNGMEFRSGPRGSLKTEFLLVLKELCKKLTRNSAEISSDELYQAILMRLAPSTSSSDPQFALNAALGSSDLMLQPTEAGKGARIMLLQEDTIAELSLYESGSQIHATITTQNICFGLYRKSDVKSKPWIGVLGQVYERVNLSTGQSVRTLRAMFV